MKKKVLKALSIIVTQLMVMIRIKLLNPPHPQVEVILLELSIQEMMVQSLLERIMNGVVLSQPVVIKAHG